MLFRHVTAPPTSISDLLEMHDNIPESEISLTTYGEHELVWLTKGGYFEVRSETEAGQVAALISMLNRLRMSEYPNTMEGVIRQDEKRRDKCQYSFMCDGKKEEVKNKKSWKAMKVLAEKLYRQYTEGTLDLGCAHSYHADYVEGRWHKRALRFNRKVGTHLFYCSKGSV